MTIAQPTVNIKRTLWITFAIASIAAGYLLVFHLDWVVIPPFEHVSAATAGTTTPVAQTTTSCPAATPDGAYYLRGRDSNGNAICGFSFYHACPYSEAVSATDPMCLKAEPQPQSKPVESGHVSEPTTAPQQPTVKPCGGTQ